MKSNGFTNKKQIANEINSTLVDWWFGCGGGKGITI
jgi:hypothetical protein